MTRSLGITLVAWTVWLGTALPAEAQTPQPASGPAAPSLALAVEPAAPAPQGTHPDEGLMIAGATTFLVSYALAAAVDLPEIVAYCDKPDDFGGTYYSCGFIGVQLIPFAHVLPLGGIPLYAGPIWMAGELVGLIIFIVGAAHHHPNAPVVHQVGDLEVRPSAPGANVGGISLVVHL